jgi:hypothetical protein
VEVAEKRYVSVWGLPGLGKHTEDLSNGPDGGPKASSAQSLTLLLNRPQREWLPFFKSRISMINQI